MRRPTAFRLRDHDHWSHDRSPWSFWGPVILALALLVLASVALHAADNPAKPLLRATVRVVDVEASQACTGVAVSPRVVLTADHCVTEGHQILVSTHGFVGLRVTLLEKRGEAALLRTDRDTFTRPLRWAPSAEPGESIWVAGHGMNSEQPLIFAGVLISLNMQQRNEVFFSGRTMPGMSGGGVIDSDGRLVTIDVGAYQAGTVLDDISTGALRSDIDYLLQKYDVS